jgi:hypothetical protein
VIKPELILYRVPTTDPHGINEVPEHLRPFLDCCRRCHDGALHSPTALEEDGGRHLAHYECEVEHSWTRGYTRP